MTMNNDNNSNNNTNNNITIVVTIIIRRGIEVVTIIIVMVMMMKVLGCRTLSSQEVRRRTGGVTSDSPMDVDKFHGHTGEA